MARAKYEQSATLDSALMQPAIDTGAKYGSISHPFPAAELIAPAPVRTPWNA